MLSTKNLVSSYKDVPQVFIFEYYLNLQEKLTGQDIKINSIFNLKDRTPSMCVYFNKEKNVYKYKDFSSGNGGSAIDLVKEIKQCNFSTACGHVLGDYNDYILHNNGGYNIEEFKQAAKYKVDNSLKRSWTTKDQYYWTQYNIGSKLLESHNVFPLQEYTMIKDEEGSIKSLTIKGDYIYGYFTKAGDLYKIYQPKNKEKKFLKIKDHIQGSEQLENHNYLVIVSSLKDIMSVKSLKLNINMISPASENVTISEELVTKWKKKYKKVLVFFDNDDPGIKAMRKYKEKFGLNCILLTLSKDVSDSIKDHGVSKVRDRLVPLINSAIFAE